jgi:hypothetical protein
MITGYKLNCIRVDVPAVPGLALKLSAAPPTTIVIAEPGPCESILTHEALLTEQMPKQRRISR